MTTPPIVLASTSRYRRALMDRLGLPFDVASPGCDEETGDLTDPVAIVEELSLRKARAVAPGYPGAVIIGSDQVLAVDGTILTKPGTAERARRQLALLSGRTHRLITGLAVIDGRDGGVHVCHEEFQLTFRTLSDEEIGRYVERDDPVDCAGSYKLESLGIWLMDRLEGQDESTIVGLPLMRLAGILRGLGISGI